MSTSRSARRLRFPARNIRYALRLALLLVLVAGGSSLHPASAAHAAIGTPVPNAEMPLLQGGKAYALKDAETNVLVFFRPGQERSLEAMREMAQCQVAFTGKPVHWSAVVSASAPAEEVAAIMRDTHFAAPVLVDEGDTLYGSLGLALHPVVILVGTDGKLAAFEPFRSVDFCPVVAARIRHALGEISDAELQAILSPAKATQGGSAQVARRYRAFAEALLRDQKTDKALEMVRKSLEKDPELAPAHALLGRILASQGKCDEAIPAFVKALSLDASIGEASTGLDACKASR